MKPKPVHRYTNGVLEFDLCGRVLDRGESGTGISVFPVQHALLAHPRADRISVRICSEGGSLVQAERIYVALRQHGAHVTTIADRQCASAATVIHMSGDLRQATAGTRFLLHAPEISPASNGARWTAGEYLLVGNYLRNWSDALVDLYAARTGQSRDVFAEEISNERHMFAPRAKSLGLIHCLEGEEAWRSGKPYWHPDVHSLISARPGIAEMRKLVTERPSMLAGKIFGHVAFSKAARQLR
ncbi:ATP-dependent Clp protease proteolytic subunit [Bradyrhizobium diazoefficiens]|uniref:ATP-dependent Clp protease proteolytic subunit n=1 Tax=Bradyrhizobium diazoefficiens TaxID=1355477 RepID=UPI0027296A5F|nr:ATP-dependent Clp protease proteolytic subunit [Bradyrhizobium diazoefficiens]WLA62373.1 ATP-dependent Clp protease proteolytic subunit [Bradyrhizobium diazoefficiens]